MPTIAGSVIIIFQFNQHSSTRIWVGFTIAMDGDKIRKKILLLSLSLSKIYGNSTLDGEFSHLFYAPPSATKFMGIS